MVVKTVLVPFWLVGAPPILPGSGMFGVRNFDPCPNYLGGSILEPILVGISGEWDVHWGNDLDLDPWPTENDYS